MYKIQNRTPVYGGYKVDEDGYFVLPRNNNNVICLYRKYCHPYGDNTIGLIDGSKIRTKDWEDLRREFFLINPDKSFSHHYCIGGSDTGVIMGYSNYKTVDRLSKEKRKVVPDEEISVETEFKFHLGHLLEESVALAFYEKEHKKAKHKGKFEIFKDSSVFFNIRTGFMQANVDYFVEDGEGLHILECKTTAQTSLWADNDAPMSYKTQALGHYPRCLEDLKIVGTYIVCLWNTNLNDLIIRKFRRNHSLEDILEKYESVFNGFMVDGTDIPHGLFNESAIAVEEEIAKTYPKAKTETTEAVQLPDNLLGNVVNYLKIYKEKSALESKARSLSKELGPFKNPIMEFLADNPEGKVNVDGVDYKIDFSNKAKKWSISAANLTVLKEQDPHLYIEMFEKGYITASEGRNFSIKEVKKPKEKAAKKPKKAKETPITTEEANG